MKSIELKNLPSVTIEDRREELMDRKRGCPFVNGALCMHFSNDGDKSKAWCGLVLIDISNLNACPSLLFQKNNGLSMSMIERLKKKV